MGLIDGSEGGERRETMYREESEEKADRGGRGR